MRRIYIVLIALIVVFGAGAAYLAMRPEAAKELRGTVAITDEKQMNDAARVFVRNPYKDDYGVARIPGYVDNLGSEDIALVSLEIQLYEKEDKRELVKYEVRGIPAGTRKSFDANAGTLGDARTATVKIVGLEVYK